MVVAEFEAALVVAVVVVLISVIVVAGAAVMVVVEAEEIDVATVVHVTAEVAVEPVVVVQVCVLYKLTILQCCLSFVSSSCLFHCLSPSSFFSP